MKLEVLGSSGSITTPRPLCFCKICTEARKKGSPYSRLGPSVFVHGPDILIDTPEEISVELNRSSVKRISICLFSHWHPDHIAGKRIFEINKHWGRIPGKNKTTQILLPEKIAESFRSSMAIMEHLEFLEAEGLVEIQIIKDDETFSVNGYTIKPVRLFFDFVFGYEIGDSTKKILIIMDEIKHWIPDPEISATDYDLVYLPFGIFAENPLTGRALVDSDNPILKNEHTTAETINIVRKLKSRQFVLGHIEEPDRINPQLAKKLSAYFSKETGKKIRIAYDGMMVPS
ncbi:hypothetical protein K7I13_10590 [Brucepastera parasyntrophica]|uniref:MBL fold metallo-hydrolase n=1 Tax=Brucepastera parasyntrophica TaxID=2880008 RepID=UPI00210ABAB6|nr:MBL fold metallo-hydrolase [Brucepastera parasyntrophica]ULQ58963.1 hypothetical protein K7I13_10590 [Brucepastera parasyntrophica]